MPLKNFELSRQVYLKKTHQQQLNYGFRKINLIHTYPPNVKITEYKMREHRSYSRNLCSCEKKA